MVVRWWERCCGSRTILSGFRGFGYVCARLPTSSDLRCTEIAISGSCRLSLLVYTSGIVSSASVAISSVAGHFVSIWNKLCEDEGKMKITQRTKEADLLFTGGIH